MYPLRPDSLKSLRDQRWRSVSPNVLFLGLTSMLTDISSEMVTSILPIYLMLAVGLTPLQFGLVEGVSQGIAAGARLISGMLSDRWQRNREVAALGYCVSAGCRLLLPAAGNAWNLIAGVIVLDRFGKGIRTSPRDALISLSSEPSRVGLAFGVHRALDTAGALLGPAAAFAILALLPLAYDAVFVASFCFAVVGVATLLCFVRNVAAPGASRRVLTGDWSRMAQLMRVRPFRSLVMAAALLGLVTVGDAFLFLALQRKVDMPASAFPLLFAGTALAYLVLAIPAGRLGDRIGRGRVCLLGYGLLLLACLSVLMLGGSWFEGLISLTLLGGYYACSDGMLMAVASRFVPAASRASGLAFVTTAMSLSRLCASLLFGALWGWQSADWALGLFSAGLAAALLVTCKTLMAMDRRTDDAAANAAD